MTSRALLDTNVLIYATLIGEPRHIAARALLQGEGTSPQTELFVSVQNLAEMWPNLTGPKVVPPDSPQVAREKIISIARLPHLTVLPIDNETIAIAIGLCETHGVTRQRYYDMQIAATMLQHGITTIFTENIADFAPLSGITAINPFQ